MTEQEYIDGRESNMGAQDSVRESTAQTGMKGGKGKPRNLRLQKENHIIDPT